MRLPRRRPPEQPAPGGEEPGEQRLREWQPRLYVSIVVLGLLIAYAIAFVLENRKDVSLHFVFTETRVSLIWLILLSIGLGVLGGILLSQLHRRRRRRRD